ncbi:MAG TPA: hypothetical protein VM677_27840 [Actinokineospora sp.]|nr:hypothetical protein [Actinokineospora sp.]
MAGHIEEAAGALNTAGQAVPIEHLMAASGQVPSVVAAIQQAGGAAGEELAQIALALQAEIDTLAGRFVELRQRLEAAAQAIMRGGY